MVSRKDIGSWLEGTPGDSAGGRPQPSGSRASVGRRLVALCIDWFACVLVNYLIFVVPSGLAFADINSMTTLGVFAIENVALVSTLGATFGHRILGLAVRRADDGTRNPGFGQAIARTALLCLVIPAVVWDSTGRGLHDRIAGTVIVRR